MNVLHRTAIFVPISLVATGSLLFAATPVSATASPTITSMPCTVKAVGSADTAGQTGSRFTLNNDGTVSAKLTVTGDSTCQQTVTFASWEAPNASKGQPYDQQILFAHVTDTFSVGTHTISVSLPECFFQADLVPGNNPTGPNGSAMYAKGTLLGSLHGGTQICATPPTTPTVTPTPVTPKSSDGAGAAQPTALPNTGSGANIFGLALGAGALGTTFQYWRKLRGNRSFNR